MSEPVKVTGDQPLKPGQYRMLPGNWEDPVMAEYGHMPEEQVTAARRNRRRHRELERIGP